MLREGLTGFSQVLSVCLVLHWADGREWGIGILLSVTLSRLFVPQFVVISRQVSFLVLKKPVGLGTPEEYSPPPMRLACMSDVKGIVS